MGSLGCGCHPSLLPNAIAKAGSPFSHLLDFECVCKISQMKPYLLVCSEVRVAANQTFHPQSLHICEVLVF
jgi:hypothetical protein